jgi:hypothetical protein
MSLVLVFGVACGGGTDPVGFGAGGEKSDEPGYPGSDGTTAASGNAPEITSLNVIFDDYASLGEVLRVEVEYTDADEDVFDSETGEGGQVLIDVTVSLMNRRRSRLTSARRLRVPAMPSSTRTRVPW